MFGLLRRYSAIALLHLYVAARIIPELLPAGVAAIVAMSLLLLASTILIPFAFKSQRTGAQPLSSLVLAWAGLLAMGMFSSLFVLTLLRDVALVAGFTLSRFLLIDAPLQQFRYWSALAVPVLAAL
ncbi:MAG: metallophosphoesterase, partial [Burkholderiales bacterium]